MTERDSEAAGPIDESPVDDAPSSAAPADKTRRLLWVGGVGVGSYMVLRGLWGVLTGEDEQP